MFGFQVKIYSGQDKVELVRANNLTGNGYRREHRSKIILTRSGFNILLHFAPTLLRLSMMELFVDLETGKIRRITFTKNNFSVKKYHFIDGNFNGMFYFQSKRWRIK